MTLRKRIKNHEETIYGINEKKSDKLLIISTCYFSIKHIIEKAKTTNVDYCYCKNTHELIDLIKIANSKQIKVFVISFNTIDRKEKIKVISNSISTDKANTLFYQRQLNNNIKLSNQYSFNNLYNKWDKLEALIRNDKSIIIDINSFDLKQFNYISPRKGSEGLKALDVFKIMNIIGTTSIDLVYFEDYNINRDLHLNIIQLLIESIYYFNESNTKYNELKDLNEYQDYFIQSKTNYGNLRFQLHLPTNKWSCIVNESSIPCTEYDYKALINNDEISDFLIQQISILN